MFEVVAGGPEVEDRTARACQEALLSAPLGGVGSCLAFGFHFCGFDRECDSDLSQEVPLPLSQQPMGCRSLLSSKLLVVN